MCGHPLELIAFKLVSYKKTENVLALANDVLSAIKSRFTGNL